jgi:hypothetical protein
MPRFGGGLMEDERVLVFGPFGSVERRVSPCVRCVNRAD